jgi:hypothetical protein
MIFDLNLLLIGLILMVIGQVIHWIMQLRRELKETHNPTSTFKEFIASNKILMMVSFVLVILAAVLNSFIAILPAAIPLGLAVAGYTIDSFVENSLGTKLKKNGK